MVIEQIYTGCLAQGAYYIRSGEEAVIIDPLREVQPYIDRLSEDKVKLKYILETHFHADFVSGHLDLAKKTGAQIVYGPNAETDFEKHQAQDGEILRFGKLSIKVLHTPGHTLESTTYLLRDENGKNHSIFSGDTLFIGDVGRPDLAQKSGAITTEDLAGMSYDSLRNKIMPLEDEVIVYPAHGAGSACGKNMSKETYDTLGNQKQTNYALRANMSKDEFIKEVTEGLAPPPFYFAENARLNKTGYSSIDTVIERGAVPLTVDKFEDLLHSKDALILDTRYKTEFTTAHIPNSIFIGIDGTFAPWVGSLILNLQHPLLLITPVGREEEVVKRLARVGYDNTLGYLNGGVEAWKTSGRETDSIESIPALEFEKHISQKSLNILDVRRTSEYEAEHVEEATSFPLDYINKEINKLETQQFYYLYCGSGYRSVIAASILKARGYGKVIDVSGGMGAITASNIKTTDYVCPTSIASETK